MSNKSSVPSMPPLATALMFRNDIVHPKNNPNGSATFVGLEHIEPHSGRRIGRETIRLEDLTGRRARFKRGDIVYGYLRPYLNKVWLADFDGLCSVDQYVLSVSDAADASYVAHYLRSELFRALAPIATTPGQLPRIRSGELVATPIPLPPLSEQRRIAAILDQTDALRRNRQETLATLTHLKSSIFEHMFGDLDSWPKAGLGELVTDTRIGLVRSAAEFGDGMAHPYVRMNAITRDGEIDVSTIKTTDASEKDRSECSLRSGDFLFNTRNSKELVGKTAIWRGASDVLFNNNIMRIRFGNLADPEFIHATFSSKSVRQELEIRKSGTTSVFAVYWRDLKSLPLPVPPIELQSNFAFAASQIEEQKQRARQHLSQLDALFASLQHRAFRGEL